MVTIRDICAADIPALAAFSAASFSQTFEGQYAQGDLSRFLSESHSADFYKKALSVDGTHIWVALESDEIVGYLKVGKNTLPCDPPRPEAFEISRLYLAPQQHGTGLAQRLMEMGFDYARGLGFREVTLSVFSENPRAQRFYARLGFQKIGTYDYYVGDHIDLEWILLKTL